MDTSKILKLNFRDVGLAIVIAFIGGIIAACHQAITQCGIGCIELMTVLNGGVLAASTYLVKNFFSDDEGRLGGAF